jgi:predicted nuclease of predicted toxin-antitoxin system
MRLVRLLADENVERRVVLSLSAAGHDVISMSDLAPGLEDHEVLRLALQDDRVILTGDKDYGDIVVRGGHATAGVVLVRLRMHASQKATHLRRVLPTLENHIAGHIAVVTERGVRVRPMPAVG